MFKRIVTMSFTAVLLFSIAGCGSETFDESTISIDKKGKVLSYSVEDFDRNVYSEEELESFVEQEISEYKAENSDAYVKLNSLKVEDDTAVLSISFSDCEEYSDFSGEVLYNDTVVNAKADGYTFDKSFYAASANAQGETSDAGAASDSAISIGAEVDVDEIISNASYKVVITSEHTDIKVDGVIKYVSDKYASLKSDSIVDLCENELIYEEGLVYIVYE